MAKETEVQERDLNADGLWPDPELSAQGSVHENLPAGFGEDNLFPDEDLSVQSVEDGAAVLAENGFGEDKLFPDEEASVESVQSQLDDGTTGTTEDDGPPAKSAPKGDWVDYAANVRGMSRDEAEEATKDELVKKYGSK